MKIIAVYPGRFQPFHKGHGMVYKWLKDKFGNATIATSDKVEAPKSPFNFNEKKKMMELAGVPANDIVQVANPYLAKEILQHHDPKTTVLVFAVSQKDMDEDPRFSFKPTKSGKPGYLQPYKGNEKKLKPFGSVDKPTGYVVVTPTFSFDVLGKPATSASELRKQFVSLDNKTQKEFIKDLFGKYDASVHKLMATKIGAMMVKPKSVKQIKENVNIGLTFARSEMPQIGASESFIKYLKNNNIESKRLKVSPHILKSSQMEFDKDKVNGLRDTPSKNPIIVSNDNHVIDGHHRWLADQLEDRNCDAYVCNLPVLELLYHAKHYSKNLNEEITHKEFAPMLDSFVSFASEKLGLKSLPNIRHKTDGEYNSFAAYSPTTNELSISTKHRHPMDVFRSVAHELVHHKQNEDGKLGKDIEKEGSTGSDIENEANSEAGKIMRWFAKANPDMFKKEYVSEEVGKLPKLFNKSDDYISKLPKGTSDTKTPVIDKEIDSNMPVLKKAPKPPEVGATVTDTMVNKKMQKTLSINPNIGTQLEEGINDPGKLKAIFLAGGPGSGKDFVMNSALTGNGLREINSDVAFEFLMKKRGLDLEMPESEKEERDETRKRAKSVTAKQQAAYLNGGLGVIINGTADDVLKIMTIKQQLENMGYETSMVFVNTSDEVSRQRNVERGKNGNRKVPDGTDKEGNPDGSPNIRKEKWDLAQKNAGELQKIFGNDKFMIIDNTEDMRKVSPEKKEEIQTNFNRLRRFAMKFTRSQNQNPNAAEWEAKEAEKRGITQYTPPKAYAPVSQPQQQQTKFPPQGDKPQATEIEQARRLGLSYYGFGRFGKKINGQNTVLYISKNGRLVKKVKQMQESKLDEDFNSYITNTHNRDEGSDSLRDIYATMTPGQETMKKKKIVKKKLAQEDNNLPRSGLPEIGNDGIGPTLTQYRPFTVTGFTMSESIEKWANSPKTQHKFFEKYGDLAEEKLIEAAMKLENCGCGMDVKDKKKSVKEFYDASKSGLYSGKRDEIEEDSPAWQRKEGKNPAGGLNQKGVASYRREHPGSKLSTAVTTKPSKLKKGSKAANRRKSFCARMSGMKKRLTSAETARDPDSRINKSLRKWNCEE